MTEAEWLVTLETNSVIFRCPEGKSTMTEPLNPKLKPRAAEQCLPRSECSDRNRGRLDVSESHRFRRHVRRARQVVDADRPICPYSRAARGNIDLRIGLV